MPFILQRSLLVAPPILVLAALDLSTFVAAYIILRFLHISVNWITWFCGSMLILLSCIVALFIFIPAKSYEYSHDTILGIIAFGVAIYAVGLWVVRQWYLGLKKWPWTWIRRGSRNLLLFVRRQHQFFGWVVFATASAHAVSYLFILHNSSLTELITGLVDWLLLLLVTVSGWWIEDRIQKKRLAPRVRMLHNITAVVFLVVFLSHV